MAQQTDLWRATIFDHTAPKDPDVNPYSTYETQAIDEDDFWKQMEADIDLEDRWEVVDIFVNK